MYRKIEALAKVEARHIAIIDMFSPLRSRETVERFGKIINHFKGEESRD